MATPRLPFLYPNLMRAVRSSFHSTRRREESNFHRRYGPAVEPNIPPPNRPKDRAQQVDEPSSHAKDERSVDEDSGSLSEEATDQPESQTASESQPAEPVKDTADAASSGLSEQAAADASKPSKSAESQQGTEASEMQEEMAQDESSQKDASTSSPDPIGEEMSQMSPYANTSAFDEVYHMPSPSTSLSPTEPSPEHKPPHMSPAPYVHHFDTYSLVLDLSKADVENESYLFKAACSELTQSLHMARNAEIQRQRTSRAQLQHELDILSQRLNQELQGMKDEIKGMFNDHKMATRENQRVIDTMVQELNYKITVSLNSDSKSEIEGLRWILTRRAALTVGICALMIILFLKYSSTRKAESPKVIKEVEKPVVKEVTQEARVVHDAAVQANLAGTEPLLGESLG
ncbi:hypothetical protein N7468_000350 [Penicillium chermesinum]|uniref:MOZ protein represents a chromatin-associated acetyltransferase n=1 Tax=Penicillium chermesinum TaxID=63820 RepID=A0A9W9TYR7_9EURO|nr:uncharacterized protein N7468_000350 [Penicillium chermesinum]KAJ5248899.1 hypothetical protein N7468_000350 [Penicillium chermesinum]